MKLGRCSRGGFNCLDMGHAARATMKARYKLLYRDVAAVNKALDTTVPSIPHLADEVQFLGQAPDKGSKSDTLYVPLNHE
jgi:hypothetical protein